MTSVRSGSMKRGAWPPPPPASTSPPAMASSVRAFPARHCLESNATRASSRRSISTPRGRPGSAGDASAGHHAACGWWTGVRRTTRRTCTGPALPGSPFPAPPSSPPSSLDRVVRVRRQAHGGLAPNTRVTPSTSSWCRPQPPPGAEPELAPAPRPRLRRGALPLVGELLATTRADVMSRQPSSLPVTATPKACRNCRSADLAWSPSPPRRFNRPLPSAMHPDDATSSATARITPAMAKCGVRRKKVGRPAPAAGN